MMVDTTPSPLIGQTLCNLALTWLILGLISGVFYREWTTLADFTGDTQLSTMHTHMLFPPTLWVYNGELPVPDAAISGMAGLGHIIMSVGLGMAFTVLGGRVRRAAIADRQNVPSSPSAPSAMSESR